MGCNTALTPQTPLLHWQTRRAASGRRGARLGQSLALARFCTGRPGGAGEGSIPMPGEGFLIIRLPIIGAGGPSLHFLFPLSPAASTKSVPFRPVPRLHVPWVLTPPLRHCLRFANAHQAYTNDGRFCSVVNTRLARWKNALATRGQCGCGPLIVCAARGGAGTQGGYLRERIVVVIVWERAAGERS